MIKRKDIIDVIDRAQPDIDWCFDTLLRLKNRSSSKNLGTDIIKFQNRLILPVFLLDRTYRKIINEKKKLILTKKSYKYSFFVRRMKFLEKCLIQIKHTIGVTKCLGDGFVWIFYCNNPKLLDEHLNHERQLLLPPGIGGIGERAFLEKLQGFGGYFVLYHGISSILRLGDVSLIDLSSTKVAAIGEIKTTSFEDDVVTMHIGYVAENREKFNMNMADWKGKVTDLPRHRQGMSSKMANRFNRQMNQINESYLRARPSPNDFEINSSAANHHAELRKSIRSSRKGAISWVQASSGLVVCTLRLNRSASLSKSICAYLGRDFASKLDGITDAAMSIVDQKSADNSLLVSYLATDTDGFPIFTRGMIPLFWWNLDNSSLRDLIYQRVVCMSLYNNAYFISGLRAIGYNVSLNKRCEIISARREIDGNVTELHELNLFIRLTTTALASTEFALDCITKSVKIANEISERRKMIKVSISPHMTSRPK